MKKPCEAPDSPEILKAVQEVAESIFAELDGRQHNAYLNFLKELELNVMQIDITDFIDSDSKRYRRNYDEIFRKKDGKSD